MGFLKISESMVPRVREAARAVIESMGQRDAKLPDLINALVASGAEVRALYTTGHWLDVDSLDDLLHAGNFHNQSYDTSRDIR